MAYRSQTSVFTEPQTFRRAITKLNRTSLLLQPDKDLDTSITCDMVCGVTTTGQRELHHSDSHNTNIDLDTQYLPRAKNPTCLRSTGIKGEPVVSQDNWTSHLHATPKRTVE